MAVSIPQLQLRSEFAGKRLKGTAIDLANDKQTGATQVSAAEFLDYTYPTHDLLKAIEAIGPDAGRPVVVMGERGLGKSHLMAALYHAVNDPDQTQTWLGQWSGTLNDPQMAQLPLRRGMAVIGESLHNHRYKYLWDLLFDRHPRGGYIRGKWDALGDKKTDVPSDKLIVELLQAQPIMLLLDEFQTWFDGLKDRQGRWAFNFVQILSEIAKVHPDLLVLVVSVRNGETDAYQQIHRVNPVQIDFKAGGSIDRIQQDRRRMLLHRLFVNRLHVPASDIETAVDPHFKEYCRLLDVPTSEQARRQTEFVDAWPYAPHLLQLLEDQVLVATDAQETRDLIRILANLFKSRGANAPVLTAADFDLEDSDASIGALLDSVANKQHATLRDRALRNLEAVRDAASGASGAFSMPKHLREVMAALWLRSIAVGNQAGADPATLQIDVTREQPIDDNTFAAEIADIIDNSFNIHQDGTRLVFRDEENPRAKLMAFARNDKLFADGSDRRHLADEVRAVLGGEDGITTKYNVVVMPQVWMADGLARVDDVWKELDEKQQPSGWDNRIPIIVFPELPEKPNAPLGKWLANMLTKRRNAVRLLLPRPGTGNLFYDRDLLVLARATLKAREWSQSQPEYKGLLKKYQSELRDQLNKRFDRFAILDEWDFTDPTGCRFSIETLKAQGAKIPDEIQRVMAEALYEPEEFEALVLEAAKSATSLAKLLGELQEPRPKGSRCIPWLGEVAMKESLLRLCARGKIAIDKCGLDMLQAHPGESEEDAWARLRSRLDVSGVQLSSVLIHEPSAVPAIGGLVTPTPSGLPQVVVVGPAVTGTGNAGGTTPPPPVVVAGGATGGNGGGTVAPIVFPPAVTVSKTITTHTAEATAPLNLVGKLEGWGIQAGTKVPSVTLTLSDLSGAQVRDLVKKLPDAYKFSLAIDKEVDA